jgi:hypothetical protein
MPRQWLDLHYKPRRNRFIQALRFSSRDVSVKLFSAPVELSLLKPLDLIGQVLATCFLLQIDRLYDILGADCHVFWLNRAHLVLTSISELCCRRQKHCRDIGTAIRNVKITLTAVCR